jgi:hypothetical protein
MAVLSWAISDTSSWGTGFSLGDYNTTAAGVLNALSDLTFSLDIAVNGAGGPQPVTISFDQFPGGTRNFDASYTPTLVTDGSWNTPEMWNHVEFTLDQLTIAGGTYDPTMPFSIDVDSGPSGMQYVIGTDTIIMDRIELWAANPIPEPGTIALLTLGGLGALVAIRRRRA